ncbi:hypothetical protein CK203_099186 [Vitis vinifera]|uniref:Uncharacterized protein n=1 Tax=Vitis vinifera TaxID=29760 RepID=A0A438BT02_VITVI|nr:hypothetical protein CK203_099186 [Vitis vinifera]
MWEASAEKGSRKAYIRTESGTCNVCSTPCSSCMHFNQALMGSKSDESSDENCRGNAVSQYSVNDVQPPFKSRTCDNLQNTASEISNLVSANSSHDSFCENAQSQAALDASEDVEMLPSENIVEDHLASEPKCVSDQRSLPNKYDDPKGLEVHDDNISCIIENKDEKTSYNADRKCSAGSVSSVCQEGFGKTVHFQTASGSHDVSDMKKSHNNSGQVSCYTQDSIQKVPPSLSTPSEVPSLKDIDIGTGSQGSGLPSCNPKVKDLEEDFSSHLKEELPECSMGHMNSSSKRGSTEYLEVETDKDGKDRPTEALKCVDQDEEVKKCNELPKLPDIEKPSLQSQLVDEVMNQTLWNMIQSRLILGVKRAGRFKNMWLKEVGFKDLKGGGCGRRCPSMRQVFGTLRRGSGPFLIRKDEEWGVAKEEVLRVDNAKELAFELGCRVGGRPSTYLGLPLGAPFGSVATWDGMEEWFCRGCQCGRR